MHPHTQFAGDRHPSGSRPMSPGGAPTRPPPSLCGTSPLSEGRHNKSLGRPRAVLLLVRPVLFFCCLCPAPASALVQPKWCSAMLVTAIRTGSHRTPHGQVQRSQSSPLGQSVQGAAGKAKDGPPFSITRSSPHRACRPALVPVSMAWAAACMLQGECARTGRFPVISHPHHPHTYQNRALSFATLSPPRYLSMLRGSMSLAKSVASAPTTASSRCTVPPLWGTEAGM